MKAIYFFTFLTAIFSFMPDQKKYTLLCLGDSYTIGEAVGVQEGFPEKTVELLKNESSIEFEKPTIIARTGWTTTELADAIKEQGLQKKFDFVTLLIGVNNEYRGLDEEEYRKEFRSLLRTALHYASVKNTHVFVLSIPDWGATPYISKDGKNRSAATIASEIDRFNAINKEEAVKAKVNYIDITPISRRAKGDLGLVATDGLHPSGKMYREWADLLSAAIKRLIRS